MQGSCVWEMVTGSNDKVFGVAATSLKFRVGPTSRASGEAPLMLFPFLSKEMLPFHLESGGRFQARSQRSI